jgi:hypothetical protein
MADVIYNAYKKYAMNGAVDLDTDTIKVALVTSAYTPSQDNDDFFNDVTNELPTAGGYTAGGASLANKAVTQDNTDNEGVFDADDLAWTSATFTARGAVIYKNRGGASSADELIAYIDFGSDKTVSSGTFTIQWAAEGILNLT